MKCKMCGRCCRLSVCSVYIRVFGDAKPPCPALTKDNKCELVGKGLDDKIGIGDGCGLSL